MDTKEYIQSDKKLLEVNGGALTGNSYATLAFAISVASALVVLLLGLIGVAVNILGYNGGETANVAMVGLMVIAHIISVYILLLLSYPFYRLISKWLVRQRFVFSEQK